LAENLDGEAFEWGGKTYHIEQNGEAYEVQEHGGLKLALIASPYVFNAVEAGASFSEEFRRCALFAMCGDGNFNADFAAYKVVAEGGDIYITNAAGQEVAFISRFVIRRYSGQDTLTIDFKDTVQNVIEGMQAANRQTGQFVYALHEIDEAGNYRYDEAGEPLYADTEILVTRKNTGEYVLNCEQITYLIDIFADPSSEHWLGTDGDGMDILARMMYGGRISLMVGFIVVFLETFIGVILGGISGYFSGWVDNLIMRLVDIFYCIPGYPILIIMGAMFDKMKMDPYQRFLWMMVILGVLGWAGVARLVRGQILSLREQEFMIAQEATGMKTSRRIFRHLVPNVMPQLIVSATMGVGGVIIYESTLSFLGLGVKHPLATWGTMINAVTSSAESIIKYTYIWIPVGGLICLTVIAFNFVGDGLRDAFDPKMKR
ncbi:MAG: ABC transporter permease, partial [Lachnospiraceae bacterium]|nr:ABC transporter permease [Lachnospiraceae bacterium]